MKKKKFNMLSKLYIIFTILFPEVLHANLIEEK